MLVSDADGDRANVLLRESRPDVVVFAPSMAAPPSYAARALAGLDVPLVVWNGPTIDRLPDGLTQSQATINSSQVAAVMLANALVRRQVPFATVTASPSDPDGTSRARPHRARRGRRVRAPRCVGAPRRHLAPGLPRRRVDLRGARAPRRDASTRSPSRSSNDAFAAVDADRVARGLEALAARGWVASRGRGRRAQHAARSRARRPRRGDERRRQRPSTATRDVLRWNPAIGITACLGRLAPDGGGRPRLVHRRPPDGARARARPRPLRPGALLRVLHARARDRPDAARSGRRGRSGLGRSRAPGRRRAERPLPGRPRSGHLALVPARARARRRRSRCPPSRRTWRLAWATGEIVEARYDTMGGPNGMFRFDSGLGVRGRRALDRLGRHPSQRTRARTARRRDPRPRARARDRGGARVTAIRSVTPISVAYPEPNDGGAIRHLTLCRIEADDGTVGWGEAVTSWPDVCRATEAMIDGHRRRARRRPRPARQRRHLAELQAAGLVVREPRRHLVLRALGDRHRPLGPEGQAARRPGHPAPRRRHHERLPAIASTHPSGGEPRGGGRPARALRQRARVPGLQARPRQEGRGAPRCGRRARRRAHAPPARARRPGADADVGPGREHPDLGRRLRDPAHERARGARPDVDRGAVRAGRPRRLSAAQGALLDAGRPPARARVERRGVSELHRRRASRT